MSLRWNIHCKEGYTYKLDLLEVFVYWFILKISMKVPHKQIYQHTYLDEIQIG